MFIIQFESPMGGVEYIVHLTDEDVDGSSNPNLAKQFRTYALATAFLEHHRTMADVLTYEIIKL